MAFGPMGYGVLQMSHRELEKFGVGNLL